MRVGVLLQHREPETLPLDYSWTCAATEPPFVINDVEPALRNNARHFLSA
jgi:hypothetical protein